ncbi:hypothetical protein [Cohnella abietis]|uniref:Uncharacterized protein n=1 Tax=Cohnella abietis TaxID=2507935 RepID=A0A3T1CY93_9BACL|nr:hypothetical protein [Cohnella abietis]BBI30804.1 hypothetical protein KCTCHS21_02030 [Cohnella abietis]
MKLSTKFRTSLLLIVVLLLIGGQLSYAEEQQKIRTDVNFEYVVDRTSGDAVPTVTITTTDYADGYASHKDTYSFENLAIKKLSIGKLDFDSYQSSGNMYSLEGSSKVYWNDNYTIKSKTELYISRLYEFDRVTKKMKVIKELTGKSRYNGRIDIYPKFKAYAINPDSYNSDNKNNVEIYSLFSNKLLGKVGFVRMESQEVSLNDTANRFTRLLAPKTLLVGKYEKMIGDRGQAYVGYSLFEMSSSGSVTKLEDLPKNAKVMWEKKVGTITYANYYDTKSKHWFIGSKTSGKSSYTPLTRVGTDAVAYFSPNDKYLIITEYKLDAKTKKRTSYVTLVIDAKKGKLLYELPAFNIKSKYHDYRWAYGDDLVRVYCFGYARDGYLNLSTGIFTSSYNESRVDETTSYTGNYADLLSPEISPAFMLDNDTRITLPAQGAFFSDKGIWYVGLNDFAEAIGATVTNEDGKLTVSRNNKVMKINPVTIISFRNQAYVPMKDLRSGLGLKLQINAEENI